MRERAERPRTRGLVEGVEQEVRRPMGLVGVIQYVSPRVPIFLRKSEHTFLRAT